MSHEVVRRFDVHVEDGDALDALSEVKALIGRLADTHQVRSPGIQQDDRSRLLEVRLEGGASGVFQVVTELVRARPGLRIRGDVLRIQGDLSSKRAYPDPRPLLKMGIEPPENVDPSVRRKSLTGPGRKPIVVAIVDSGIMVGHPDLEDFLWKGTVAGNPEARGARCIDGAVDDDVTDQDGHGTRLAGTILAAAERDPAVRLMTVKFFDANSLPAAKNAARAINFAVQNGADIINLSWDLGLGSPDLEKAIQNACDRDRLVVIAAGNAGTDNDQYPPVPALYAEGRDQVVTVMATNRYDEKASFSNYGEKTVDLAAPGVGVVTTRAAVASGAVDEAKRYRSYTGTSAAAAHVAGVAALLKARNPDWGGDKLKRCLVASVVDGPHLRCVSGGRLDPAKALLWRQSTPLLRKFGQS